MDQKQVPLHDQLIEVLSDFEDRSERCYFEPPEGTEMKYPCIVYHKSNRDITYADNIPYLKFNRYTVTIIDEDPDSKLPDRMDRFLYLSSDRDYCYDGLWHYAFTLFTNAPRIKEEETNHG